MASLFVQVGIILFPICIYQIWTFGKSFNKLPLRTPLLGLYGGVTAVFCHLMPFRIFGETGNFQPVPIILSILYGKRKAGLLAILILGGYQIAMHQSALGCFAFILAYSTIPFIICMRFDRLTTRQRLWTALALTFITLVVELVFMVVYVLIHGTHGLAILSSYDRMLCVAGIVQFAIMTLAFYLLEYILQNGRIRHIHESLIRHNPLAICAFDIDDLFTLVNAAYEQLTGYTEAELIGRSRLELWSLEDRKLASQAMTNLCEENVKQTSEITLRHKNGRKIEARSTIIPIVAGDQTVGYFGMVTDITETKLAEEMLRTSEKLSAIGELAAGVAHEIRNPLTALKGFLQLIPSTDKPDMYIQIMQEELGRIETIVSELLVLAKPQEVDFSDVDVRKVLHDVLPLVQAQADMKSIVLSTHFTKETLKTKGISNHLKQVFLNIIKNAIEAADSGGHVDIHLERAPEDGRLLVRIRDDGPGIPAEILSRIGEPFVTTKEAGTGLGLLVCKRIISNHEGRLDILSEVGQGTEVRITLPAID